LNFNTSAVTVNIEVFNRSGDRIAGKTVTLAAKRRECQLLTQYFPELVSQNISSGYISVRSDRNVASFALFGTTSLSVLAAVPPQAIP